LEDEINGKECILRLLGENKRPEKGNTSVIKDGMISQIW
jgi:hypothetical protein